MPCAGRLSDKSVFNHLQRRSRSDTLRTSYPHPEKRVPLSLLLTIAVGLLGWAVFKRLNLPSPAMLGSMVSVAVANVLFGFAEVPTWLRVMSQGICGAFIAVGISLDEIRGMRKLVTPLLILLALFTCNTFLVGILLHEALSMNIYTALFSCIPGGITDVTIIAMDYDCDVSTVAIMQTFRLVSSMLTYPFLIKVLDRHEDEKGEDDTAAQPVAGQVEMTERAQADQPPEAATQDDRHRSDAQRWIVTIAISLLSSVIGRQLSIPGGMIFFPIVAVLLVNFLYYRREGEWGYCDVPDPLKRLAQLCSGCIVGATVTRDVLDSLSGILLPCLLLLLGFWTVNALYIVICSKFKLLDKKTALLVSAPGGSTDMVLLSLDYGADASKTGIMQLGRIIYSISLMPNAVVLFVSTFYAS